jgi:hypothetical protein
MAGRGNVFGYGQCMKTSDAEHGFIRLLQSPPKRERPPIVPRWAAFRRVGGQKHTLFARVVCHTRFSLDAIAAVISAIFDGLRPVALGGMAPPPRYRGKDLATHGHRAKAMPQLTPKHLRMTELCRRSVIAVVSHDCFLSLHHLLAAVNPRKPLQGDALMRCATA